ncbi:hypothetical protein [Novosphingobium sp. AP12]|uniref:hypothetical protein n=1 Tax=Novosphingobium sp. AP12 TaxID=1144305 RepID=UPI000271EC39|nr:hypothetical protein [Novosphingobium sp. AP12]EJL33188.1 hypothetical protein PMI02_01223 [Novosphingobium sp. AP12]
MTTILPAGTRSLVRPLRGALAAASLALLMAACTSGATGGVASAPQPPKRTSGVPSVRQPTRTPTRDAQVQMAPGLEGVIGANQGQLVRLFGEPRLDVWEGDARKLQFTGTACVLDVFLYPSTTSKEPHASYVDARRSSDGQDVDRGACVAALKGK